MGTITISNPGWGAGLDASSLAQEIMQMVQGFVADAQLNAESIADVFDDLDQLGAISFPSQISNSIDFNRARDLIEEVLADFPDDPTLLPIDTTIPTLGDLETLPGIPEVSIDDFSKSAPDLNYPTTPSWETFIAPTADAVTYPDRPDKPSIAYPDVPILSDILIPDPYALEIPTFDETLVDEELTAPSNTFTYNEETYASILKDAVESGLLDAIQNGNYGLEPQDEEDLFNRGRERELKNSSYAQDDAIRMFTLSGFPMPTGAMHKAQERMRMDAVAKISDYNRDVTLKRADLYWEGKKFSYDKALELEKIMIDLHNATWERALNAAKAEVQVAIDIFNALVARSNARNQRFLALAQVYEVQIRAEISKVELYKAQLEGSKIKSELNKNLIDLYTAQLQGVKTLVDVYTADVQAYNIMAEVEKLKVDIFRAQIEAYVGEVQAKKSEFEAYEAGVRGEVAKVDAYKAEAQAYQAKVDGKKTYIEALKLSLEAYVEKNRAILEEYRAEAETYKDKRQAELVYNQSQIEAYKGKVQAFDAEMGAIAEAYKLSVAAEEAEYRAQTQAISVNVENSRVQLERVVQIARLQMEAAKAKADIFRAMIASSLASINCNASLSGSQSENYSESQSKAMSASTVASRSDSTVTQSSTSASTSSSIVAQTSVSVATQASVSASSQTSSQASASGNENHNHNYTEQAIAI